MGDSCFVTEVVKHVVKCEKKGLFNSRRGKEQAQVYIAKKRAFARKQEKTKGKGDSCESPFPGLSDTT